MQRFMPMALAFTTFLAASPGQAQIETGGVQQLGEANQFVLSGATAVDLNGGSGSQNFQLRGETTMGFFVVPHLYVGLGAVLDLTHIEATSGPLNTRFGGGTKWELSLLPQAGLSLSLGGTVTLFPKVGLLYAFTEAGSKNNTNSNSSTNALALSVDVPFVFQLAPHLGFTVGPNVTFGLKDSDTVKYGARTGILAWF